MPAAEDLHPAADAPLSDRELDHLFAPFGAAPRIALAVSGGADSLALMVAADRWCRRGAAKPDVVVLTVDHRLRKKSRAEALAVQKLAKARGMKVRILTREGPKPKSDVEGEARRARYALLVDACRAAGATHLLVAHHRDDLAETFLLRLKRGAGVFGLAAMRPLLDLGGVVLSRLFLGVARSRLAATTAAAGLTPVDDPMNHDPRFDRTRMRQLLPLLRAGGIDPERLAETAARLADAADAIDAAATHLLAKAVEADALAVAWLTPTPFVRAPRAIMLRALWRLLVAVGGDDYPPRHARLADLADAVVSHERGRFKRTLGGVVIEWRGGRFAFYRELGRKGLGSMPVASRTKVIWDHRFEVQTGRIPAGLTLGQLGEDGRRVAGAQFIDHAAGALAGLPALRKGGRVVAVPLLGVGDAGLSVTMRSVVGDRLARPPLFPDLTAGR